jgi:hypothetical protein
MIESREILTGNALDYKPAALSFTPQPAGGHAAIWEGNLRCRLQAQRRIWIDSVDFGLRDYSAPGHAATILRLRL